MTQKDRVLRYIKNHGTITAQEALAWCGVMRLASRIHELREDGWQITVQSIKVQNRFNESCVVARYSVKDDLSKWIPASLTKADKIY